MKNMFKKFLIGTLAVVAFVITANLALASYDFGSTILKVGSRGQYVKTLQSLVEATPVDGIFGPKTKAKVVAWQVAHGLTADGLFGNMSKAKANGAVSGNFPAGCSNASGFSMTTGFACSSLNANTFPVGCTNASGFSTTTGFSCKTGFPTGCTNASGFSTTTGRACNSINANTFPAGCSNASGFSTSTGVSCLTGLAPTTTPIVRGGGSSHHRDTIISATAIAGVTAPVTGETPVSDATDGTGYTVTSVTWTPTGTFASNTVYTATITIAPASGYTLTGITHDQFTTITGATSVSNEINSGVITAVFPATATTIVATAIAGVTAPITGATPVTTVTAGTGYTGTVTWSGTPSTFASAISYTATITLTATSGYTLTGVTADQFTIAGSTSDTNPINSGVITAVFPATATGYTNVPSAVFTTSTGNTLITITLAEGSFKAAPLYATDFTFGGTNATAIATHGAFGRTDATHVAISGLSGFLAGGTDNTVTVLGATQTSQVITVTAVAS